MVFFAPFDPREKINSNNIEDLQNEIYINNNSLESTNAFDKVEKYFNFKLNISIIKQNVQEGMLTRTISKLK